MPIGRLSIRIDGRRRDHHLWINNRGRYWVHYTLNWDGRTRRIRRSLRTRDLEEAIRLRDELFDHIRKHGEFVAPRTDTFLGFRAGEDRPASVAWFEQAL